MGCIFLSRAGTVEPQLEEKNDFAPHDYSCKADC
jgi:hypothetical protein